MNRARKEKNTRIIAEISVFLATFLVHIFFIRWIQAPQYVDEYRTFLTGDFLSGKYDLSLLHMFEEQNIYYGFGQVIFYIPFFWIFDSIDKVFQASLVFNGFIMSLIPVLAIKIFRQLLPECSELQRAGLAYAVGMFSPLIFSSKTVTNEAFLLFFPVLILYLIVIMTQNKNRKMKILFSALLGFCSMYMYTLNGRSLAIIAAVFLSVMYMEIIRKEKKIFIPSYLISMVIVYIINYVIKQYVVQQFHHPIAGSAIVNSDFNIMETIKQFQIGKIFTTFTSWSGNWFYVVFVSGGMSAVLITALFIKKNKGVERNILFYALMIIVMTSGMLTCVSYNAYTNPSAIMIDYYIYGRYYDLLVPVALIVGLCFFVQYGSKLKNYLITLAILLSTGCIVSIFLAETLIQTGSSGLRILNIGTMLAFLPDSFATTPLHWHFWMLSTGIVVLYTLFTWLGKKKKFLLISILFTAGYLFAVRYTMISCKMTADAQQNHIEAYRNLVAEYNDLDEEYKTIYYLYEDGTQRGVNIQYALYDWKVAQVDMQSDYNMNLDMITENSFVLTQREAFLDMMYDDYEFICEQDGLYLYAYGQELLEKLNIDSQGRTEVSQSIWLDDDETALVIKKDAHSYGPYLNLDAGTYYVEINGSNLQNMQVKVTKNSAVDLLESTVIEKEEGKIYLKFSSDSYMENVEVSVYNQTGRYATIYSMSVKTEAEEEIFATTGERLYTTEKADIQVILGDGSFEPIFLNEGTYLITVKGMDVNTFDLVCKDLDCIHIEEVKKNKNIIVFELQCDENVKYPLIEFQSNETTQKLVESISIERTDNHVK